VESAVSRKDLETWFDRFLNVSNVQDSLPNGLQVEGRERIAKVVVAVSITFDVIEYAVRVGAGAIVVHHGMFWKHDDPTVKGHRRRRLGRILEHEINLFAYHLPLDLHPELSHNRLILSKIGAERIEECGDLHRDFTYGLKGIFPAPVDFFELVARVDAALRAEARFFKYGADRVGSVFVVSGAGRSLADRIPMLGVDAYLTGDAQESTEYIAKEEGLNYIYAGHYNTEKVGVEELGKRIAQTFGVEVLFYETENRL
jgi:dinuclear metal center YbgI/SA1388 family protein